MAHRKGIYAVYDIKAECFNDPFLFRTNLEAIRAFGHAAQDRSSAMGAHPGDFTLFHLGHFEIDTGAIELLDAKASLGNLLELTPPTEP